MIIPSCYLAVRSITGSQGIALTAAAIAVVFPTWVVPSGAVLTDVPAAILVSLMVWALVEGQRRQSVWWLIGGGAFWGAATLMRAVSLVYGPAIILWLLVCVRGAKKSVKAIVAVMIPFILMLVPWTIRNLQAFGTLVVISTQGGTELYKSNNPRASGILAADHEDYETNLSLLFPKSKYPNEAIRSNLFQAEAMKFIRDNPRRFAELCLIRFGQLWKIYSPRVPFIESLAVIASFGLALPFFLIEAFRSGWRRGPELLLVLIIICHTAVHVIYTSSVRYRIPIEPLILAMAVAGFYWVFDHWRNHSGDYVSWPERALRL